MMALALTAAPTIARTAAPLTPYPTEEPLSFVPEEPLSFVPEEPLGAPAALDLIEPWAPSSHEKTSRYGGWERRRGEEGGGRGVREWEEGKQCMCQ
jgi:hypothetical protein